MKEQPALYNLNYEEMCRKDSLLNEENHDKPGIKLHSDANGVEMSRNDEVMKEKSTNDDKLADKDHWWERYYGKKDMTISMYNNHQDDGDKVVLLIIGDGKYGDIYELTDGRPDVSGGGWGCHEDGGTITDDPPDKDKTEDKMKRGIVVINARKLWAPSISRKAGWCTEGWKEREREKKTQQKFNRQRYVPTTSLLKQAQKRDGG
ncbi:13831_t:CDS:2, partial [Acaulospora morrowiae]